MRKGLGLFLLVAAPVVAVLGSFLLGRYPLSPLTVARVIGAEFLPLTPDWPAAVRAVVIEVRLPRILGGLLIGGGLALAGACYQGVFRNPLVSPFVLGVSAGAGFGAALAILYFPYPGAVAGSAFVCGLAAVGVCFALSHAYRAAPTLVMVLTGVIVGAFFTALLSLLKYAADPESRLPLIEFWLLGSLAGLGWRDIVLLAVLVGPAGALLLGLRWRLNLLALGEAEAEALGVDTALLRGVVVVAATLVAAATVAAAGIVGWVGLVMPHAARILVGADFRRMLPVATVLGGCYLVGVDDVARTVTTAELPIGILTALVGAPVFALLLRRRALGWA